MSPVIPICFCSANGLFPVGIIHVSAFLISNSHTVIASEIYGIFLKSCVDLWEFGAFENVNNVYVRMTEDSKRGTWKLGHNTGM